ncbi:MAG: AAA family ATPase [Oscillospiraceae bacterium]|nr:AAA family ATPase [Oscillospiraceae bacterium]
MADKNCIVISISNQKGGVGKTTTTGALMAGFTKRGHRVLAIDLDPQGNLTFSVKGDNEISASIYDVLRHEVKPQHAVQHLECGDLISSNILLSSAELDFIGSGREFLLRDVIESLRVYYDYIFIDTPPNLGILTINAFACSDYIVVPVLSDIFSLQGLAQLHDSVKHIKEYCNPKLEFAGILLTRFNARSVLGKEILGTAKMIAKSLDIPLFATRIRSSVTVSEAQSAQTSLLKYAPANGATKDYMNFVDELLKRGV